MSTAALLKQAQDAGLTLRLVDGKVKVSGKQSSIDALIEPLRQHKDDLIRWFTSASNDPEPPTDPADWRELARAYHGHHFGCKACCAAGQGRGLRCGVGAALWHRYQFHSTHSGKIPPHLQADLLEHFQGKRPTLQPGAETEGHL